MPYLCRQTWVVDKTPERTLAANLHWLMTNSADYQSAGKLAKKAGVDQKTIWRVLNQTNVPTLDKLTKLAGVFKIEAWQLLAPRLGADFYKIDSDRRVVPVQEAAPPLGYRAPEPGRVEAVAPLLPNLSRVAAPGKRTGTSG